MNKEQLTWAEICKVATSIFNIMGINKEVGFAEKVWQKLSEFGLTSYSNSFERVKIKVLFLAFWDLHNDFCNVAYDRR